MVESNWNDNTRRKVLDGGPSSFQESSNRTLMFNPLQMEQRPEALRTWQSLPRPTQATAADPRPHSWTRWCLTGRRTPRPTSLSEPLLLTGYQGSSMPTVPQSELLFTQQELLVCAQSRAAPWLLRVLFCCKEIGGYFGATWQKEHVKLGNCQVIWTDKKSEECEHVLEYLWDLYYPNSSSIL